jgi:hypothetical protein
MLAVIEHPLVVLLSTCDPFAQFVAVMGYQNGKGDVGNYSLLFNISYARAVEKSLKLINEVSFLDYCQYLEFKKSNQTKIVVPVESVFLQAQKEVFESLSLSHDGENHATHEGAYHEIYGLNGQKLKGCKLHDETRLIHLYGFAVHYLKIKDGNVKPPNSSTKTLAKKWIRSQLPVGKFVQFRLQPGKYDRLTIRKISLLSREIPELSLSEENSLLRLALEMRDV